MRAVRFENRGVPVMRLTHLCRRPVLRHRSAGLSIVELLVGIAIGLFILAGATLVTSTQLTDNRALLLETQIQQDLRATADLISRDLRRAGYWGNASSMAWPAAGVPAVANMYPAYWETTSAGGRTEYNYAISNATLPKFPAPIEDNVLDASEQFGFAWNEAELTIEAKLGGAGWQTLTDPSVVQIRKDGFKVSPTEQKFVVPCAKYCPTGVANDTTCWPTQKVRDLTIQITGYAVHDPNVIRTVRSGVRLRNDEITGSCPA